MRRLWNWIKEFGTDPTPNPDRIVLNGDPDEIFNTWDYSRLHGDYGDGA